MDNYDLYKVWYVIMKALEYGPLKKNVIHLDFVDNPDAPIERHHFGVRTGVNGLIKELNSMKAAGVDHIGLHFRRNEINIEQSMEDIAKNVLPVFHK